MRTKCKTYIHRSIIFNSEKLESVYIAHNKTLIDSFMTIYLLKYNAFVTIHNFENICRLKNSTT